jgi:hypothetical protein
MSLYNQTKKFFNKKKNKFITGALLGVVLVAGIFGFGVWNLNQSEINQAKASDITVSPGGNVRISFWYGNETDEDQGNTKGNLEVRIGTYLQVQKMYDVFDANGDGNFDNETMYEVCTNYLTNLPPTNPNATRKRMFYIPRSANNTNGCSGNVVASADTLQTIALPLGNKTTRENFGRLIVDAKLDQNVLNYLNDATGENYKMGDVLAQDLNFQGASAAFRTQVGTRTINTSNANFSLTIGNVSIIPITPTNLTPGGMIPSQTFDQATNLTCQSPAQVNSTTSCNGTLPASFIAPSTPLKLNLQGQTSVTCTFASNQKTFTCINMPSGSNSGTFPVQASIGTSTPTNTGENVEILADPVNPIPVIPITPTNLATGGLIPGQTFDQATNLTCQEPVTVGGTSTCSGSLPNGFTAPATGSLALNVQGQSPVNCIFAANGKDFTCSNMPVGNTAGQFPIQSQVNGSTPTNTGEVVTVATDPTDPLYLFPSSAIEFTPTKQNPAIYGEENLVITLNHNANITECSIRIRQYGTQNQWINLNGQINGNKCIATFPKASQNSPRWDFDLRITDTNDYKWGANPSYFMYYGAISLIEISACNVDQC